MNLSKVKEVYLKNQLPFTLAISTIILIISFFWSPALYISAGFVIVSYIFLNVEDIFAGTFYYILFSGITIFFIAVCAGAILIILAKYIYDAYKKKVKVYKYILLLTTAIVIIFSFIHYKANEYGFFAGLFTIAILYFIYIMFCYHKNISIKKLFTYLFIGTVSTLFITIIFSLIPNAKISRFYDWELIYTTIKEKMFLVYKTDYRLELLTFHPNYLSIHCLMLISYAVYGLINYNQTKKSIILNITMIILSIILGFLTLSKTFYILFFVIVIYSIWYLIYHFRAKSIKYILPIIFAIIILCIVFINPLTKTIARLLPNAGDSNLNDITTGRIDIWKTYLEDIISSPLKILFGEGLFTNYLGIGPHNFYLLIFFRFGIVGTLMLVGLVILYFISYDEKIIISLKRILPIAIFLLYSIQEAEDDERVIYLIVTFILMFFATIDDKNLQIEDTQIEQRKDEFVHNNKNKILKGEKNNAN